MSAEPGRDGSTPPHPTIYDLLEAGDEEDDDIFEPATEPSTATDMDEDEEEGDEFTDASESLPNVQVIFEGEDDDEDGEEDENDTETEAQNVTTARRQGTERAILHLGELLGGGEGLRRILANHSYRIVTAGGLGLDDDDYDEDDDEDFLPYRRQRRRRNRNVDPNRFPKVPSDSGRQLMNSGLYGSRDSCVDVRRRRKRSASERLMWRRLGVEPRSTARRHNRLLAQELIPNTTLADKIIHYDSRAYSGQFSDDGNFFFSCTQNFKVQMYDTSNPYEWKYYKTVDFPFGQWTITDATLSPDNKFLAYSSIRHTVCLAPTDPNDPNDHTLLDFTNYAPGATLSDQRAAFMGRQGFGIWSLRFSGDGREIVAGTSDHNVLVYDLETRKTTLKLRKHTDDVNAVCFGDKSSPHILFSGSDDQTLRIWDRRSMADGREAGVFVGHTEGLTYVDAKGDGRYVLSNGKDQMMKLWDLRKMVSPQKFDRMNIHHYTTNFDYRFAPYNDADYTPNPDDCSVVTFRGHRVLKTLIRCHFSPPTSSNGRYVYSGSEDGKVYIWNLDATLKATIDVAQATRGTRPKSNGAGDGYDWDMGYNSNVWKTCVRDASWSPTVPVLAATSWNGWGMSTGTVSVHSWNDDAEEDEGDPPMGANYDARLQPRGSYKRSGQERARDRTHGRGLRSNIVRPQRFGRVVLGAGDPDEDDGGW